MIEMIQSEIARLKAIEEAAKAVVLAAWTDRFSRLHGHATVAALDVALTEKPIKS